MRILLARAVVLLLAGALPHAVAHGQRSPAPGVDTALVRVLVDAAREVATPPRAHFAPAGAAFPWRITIPDSTSATGRALRDALGRALHARPLVATDTIHARLVLADLVVDARALRATLAVGLAWKCPNGAWMASTTGYQLRARRVRGRWQAAHAEVEIIADPAPCAALAPETTP